MAPSLDSSWIPQGDLPAERTWLIGTILVGIGYGIVVILSAICLNSLYRSLSHFNRLQQTIMIAYVVLIFILSTLFTAGTIGITQMSFIEYRLYPGGPAGFEVDFFSLPIDSMANLSAAFANWLSEGLMCWRCIVMYSSDQRFIWVKSGIPILLYVTEVVFGIMWIIQVARPSSSVWNVVNQVNFTPAYFGLGFGLNIAATIAIVGRLLLHRHRISAVLGAGYGVQYISMAAIIVESAVLSSILALLVIIPFTLNHPLQNTTLQFFGVGQVIPPLLIIHRVASGKAWKNQTSAQLMSSVDFSSRRAASYHVNMEALSSSDRTPAIEKPVLQISPCNGNTSGAP